MTGDRLDSLGSLSGLSFGDDVHYVAGSDGTTNYAVINNVTTFQRFHTDGFVLVDALLGYDLGHASRALNGWSVAINTANLFDKTHITACPFANRPTRMPPIGGMR
jgi:iron complex outermembrane receptor protein